MAVDLRLTLLSQAWWHMPVIPVLGMRKQEDQEFKASLLHGKLDASLGYIERPCLKNK
jgi:hypothetical protein